MIELWSTLGRHVLQDSQTAQGFKFALMCAHKALGGNIEAPMVKASTRRLLALGAAHQLAGRSLLELLDAKHQERQSQTTLRELAVGQFERTCEYARLTKRQDLAECGARLMWNGAIALLDAVTTRANLIQPLLTATSALAECKYKSDADFVISMYTGLFECYAAEKQWDSIQRMLNEAFSVVPSRSHRRLWALRMLALSRQGRDVVVAMGKMKETQANAQANIWMVLAHAAAKREDQLIAYQKAAEILQTSAQAKVVEVRMELADWMLRNQIPTSDALDQLQAAADFLLDIEEENEAMNSPDGPAGEQRSVMSKRSAKSSKSSDRKGGGMGSEHSAKRSVASKKSRGSMGSRRSSMKQGSTKSKDSSARSRAKVAVEENDAEMPASLTALHYEQLVRIFTMMAGCAQS